MNKVIKFPRGFLCFQEQDFRDLIYKGRVLGKSCEFTVRYGEQEFEQCFLKVDGVSWRLSAHDLRRGRNAWNHDDDSRLSITLVQELLNAVGVVF